MKIVDANIVLRYLLNDIAELADKAAEVLENNKVFVPNEVIAEVVYVLEKVYGAGNREISSALLELFGYENLQVSDIEIINEALKLYGNN
jgi:predicted nucleic-acid-binding protein